MLSEFTKRKRGQKVFNYTLLPAEDASRLKLFRSKNSPTAASEITFLDVASEGNATKKENPSEELRVKKILLAGFSEATFRRSGHSFTLFEVQRNILENNIHTRYDN